MTAHRPLARVLVSCALVGGGRLATAGCTITDVGPPELRCSLALDDYDLWIATSPGQLISTWDMEVADLTGDGTADLVLANFARQGVRRELRHR